MAKNFKFKRPQRPEHDRVVFDLLRAMRGNRTCDLARQSFLSPGTISKLRTRRTRYPQHMTVVEIYRSLGMSYAALSVDERAALDRLRDRERSERRREFAGNGHSLRAI